MRKTWIALAVALVSIVIVFFCFPQKLTLVESVKPCFNQLQWRELDFSQADVIYVNFYVHQDKIDRVSMKEISCTLKKLGFPKSVLKNVALVGGGAASSKDPRFAIDWYTESACRVLHGCDDGKESRYKDNQVSISILEIKRP